MIVRLPDLKCTLDLECCVMQPDNRNMGRKNASYLMMATAAGAIVTPKSRVAPEFSWGVSRPPTSARAKRLFSGARAAPNGCSHFGDAFSPVSSSCRSAGKPTSEFIRKVQTIVEARVVVAGDELHPNSDFGIPFWKLTAEDWNRTAPDVVSPDTQRNDCAEIMFTSGSTADHRPEEGCIERIG